MVQKEYRYYSMHRPIDIGTFPKPAGNPPSEVINFDDLHPVEDGRFKAWGYLVYPKSLTELEIAAYELKPSLYNPDVQQIMNSQASKVGCWEERNELPADRRLTVWSASACDFVPAAHATQDQLAERFRIAEKFPRLSQTQMKMFSQQGKKKSREHER